MRQLIFVHGRSQQGKNAAALKHEWVEAWEKGLAKSGLTNPLPDSHIRFPFYGDTLIDMLNGKTAAQAVEVIVKGPAPTGAAETVMREMIAEIATGEGLSEADIRAVLDEQVIEKGPLNWKWVQGILEALDRVKPISAKLVALVTADVANYLTQPATRTHIDDGLRGALLPDVDAVVVSHSLGTVVAYSTLMSKTGAWPGVRVPLFVTLGSPLAVNAVKSRLKPHTFPPQVGHWFNAMDEGDAVALHPLTPKHFNTGKTIENDTSVDNWTDNQHGIVGYLDDKTVARRIFEAITTS